MKITGYIRVSTSEQVTEGMSLEAQESKIRAWADANDAEVVEIVREEGKRLQAPRRPSRGQKDRQAAGGP